MRHIAAGVIATLAVLHVGSPIGLAVLLTGVILGRMTRNPHATALRYFGKKAIDDKRHAKRSKSERQRDALQRERDERDGTE